MVFGYPEKMTPLLLYRKLHVDDLHDMVRPDREIRVGRRVTIGAHAWKARIPPLVLKLKRPAGCGLQRLVLHAGRERASTRQRPRSQWDDGLYSG